MDCLDIKYKFLELAIKNSINDQVKVKDLLPFENFDNYTILEIIKPLKNENLIDFYMGGLIVIKPSAKKKIKSLKNDKIRKPTIIFLKWIIGIITSLLIAYFIAKLGLST